MENLIPIDELREIAKKQKSEKLNVTRKEEEKKSLSSVGINDVEFTLDKTQSYEKQAEDVVGAMATAKAVQDEETQKDLANKKAEELKAKASAKERSAEAECLAAETIKQKAIRSLYEAVLEDFMITKHLPRWLMVIVVSMLSPLYIAKILTIHVPLGFAKSLMECVDNIFVRYSNVNDELKPKVRATIWVLVVTSVVIISLITALKFFGKI